MPLSQAQLSGFQAGFRSFREGAVKIYWGAADTVMWMGEATLSVWLPYAWEAEDRPSKHRDIGHTSGPAQNARHLGDISYRSPSVELCCKDFRLASDEQSRSDSIR